MPDSDNTSPITRFINNLKALDAGEGARFKRNAGKTLAESHNVLGLFYHTALKGVHIPEYQEETYFLVATLFPFEKKFQGEPQPFAQAMRTVRLRQLKKRVSKNTSQKLALDTRMERLLDADRQQLPYYLRREVQFVTNEGQRLNWKALLRDLLGWNASTRYVQKQWARMYFGSPAPEESEETV